jgi:hypothetical protein
MFNLQKLQKSSQPDLYPQELQAENSARVNYNSAITDLKLEARKHTYAALEALHGVMTSPESPASAIVTAAKILLERGWGTAETKVVVEKAGDPRDMTLEELQDERAKFT